MFSLIYFRFVNRSAYYNEPDINSLKIRMQVNGNRSNWHPTELIIIATITVTIVCSTNGVLSVRHLSKIFKQCKDNIISCYG